jgi:hypothetical protein
LEVVGMDFSRRLYFLAILFAGLFLWRYPAGGQTFRGGINGVVTDQAGAAIAGAQVTATADDTQVSHATVSSSAGEFVFQDLPLGSYTVTASASGFETLKVGKVMVTAGTLYTLPMKLTVASQATTVEVSAAALTLDTTSTTQTTVLQGKAVQDIPLNGRDFTQLIGLTPGFAGYVGGGYGSLNGTRANQMNWQIDGIDNNDLWHNIPAVNQGGVSGIAGIVLPIDAVEQFSAQTQAPPETGRNPGGTINLSLRSGTNGLHGSAYYFNRNEALGAKNPFTATKQEVRNYNFGFSAGGPFIKDKFFWFTTFEKQRFVIGVPAQATEPSHAYQQEAEAILANHGIAVNPVALALINGTGSAKGLWPSYALNGPATSNNYTSVDPEYGYSYNGLIKLDYTINESNSLSAHWFGGQGNQVAPVGSVLKPYYEVAPIHVQNYALVYNHVFTPAVTNQVLAGVNYFNQVFHDFETDFEPATLGLVTGAPFSGSPNIHIGLNGEFDPVGMTPPEGRNDITGHLTDDLSWTVGKHQFKFGGEYRQAQLDEFYHRHALGALSFDGAQGPWTSADLAAYGGDTNLLPLADFMAGYVSPTASSIAIGNPDRQVFVNTFDVFAQDAWQITPKFSFNYGVRYDYEGPLHNDYKNLSVFRPSLGGIVFQGQQISSLYDRSWLNFSPRLGFAYQAMNSTVVRGGFGFYFDTPNLNPFLDNRPGNGAPNGVEGNPSGPSPVLTVQPLNIGSSHPIQSGVPVFPTSSNADCPCALFSVDKNFRNAYNMNFNLQLEQSLGSKMVAQIGYVGSEGRRLLSLLDINQSFVDPGVGVTPGVYSTFVQSSVSANPLVGTNPINQIESIGTSNYNALQATLRTQSWHGLTTNLMYTWSHNLDIVTAYRGALPQDSHHFKGDYGNSDFDTRNTFVGFFSYEIPGSSHLKALTSGWQANSLLSLHGGQPFSVMSSSDTTGTNEGVQRANVVGNPYQGIHHNSSTTQRWLNPAAFADPAQYTFGDSRRNQYYGPGYGSWDLSFFKNTAIGERVNTQFRVEMFNLLNKSNFAPPINTVGSKLGLLYDTIGDYNGAPGIGAGEPFNTQLGLKIIF